MYVLCLKNIRGTQRLYVPKRFKTSTPLAFFLLKQNFAVLHLHLQFLCLRLACKP